MASQDPPQDSEVRGLGLRKRFSCFTPEEESLLADLREPFTRHAESVVERFYEHLLDFPSLRPFLKKRVVRLRVFLRDYLLSLTAGEYGEQYVEDRRRIGRAHEQVGLPPQWYLGAYCVFLDLLIPVVMDHYRDDAAKGSRAVTALAKLMNLDAQIVLETYFEGREQKAVEHAEQLAAVGELAASIAHEVRNPLAGMKGAMEMLRKPLAADDSKREVMDEVVAQIVRLENLVRDLLTFARPHPMNRQPVHLPSLLERVLRLVQESPKSAEVRVTREFDPEAEKVEGDPPQLEQVFLNLIHNALQAMGGEGTLTLSTRAHEGVVAVSVKDSGKGIPPGDLSSIFQPFFTTKHRGSGLGLSIVQKIVEAHGGGIEVDSELGGGTNATVTLPGMEVSR